MSRGCYCRGFAPAPHKELSFLDLAHFEKREQKELNHARYERTTFAYNNDRGESLVKHIWFEVQEYKVVFRQLEERDFGGVTAQVRGLVRCIGRGVTNQGNYQLDVYFLTTASDFPQPVVDLENRMGSIFLPMVDMLTFVDILRNEKPIYGYLDKDTPSWTSITTDNEPVGEGEEAP